MGGVVLTGLSEVAGAATERLVSPTGADLLVRHRAVSQPKAVIGIQHGMAEHSARYGAFQDALAQAGYASIVHDHRGHGLTHASDAREGHFADEDGWSKVVADALCVMELARTRHPDAPLFAFGHSMGGIVAANLLLAHADRIGGAAIWNIGFRQGAAGLAFRGLLRLERMRRGSDVPSPLARKLTFDAFNRRFAPNRTEFDWLSRDEREVDLYVADPHCGHPVTVGMWLDVQDGMKRAADDEALIVLPRETPLHVLGGSRDPVTEGGKKAVRLSKRMRATGLSDVTCTVLEGARHEALHETNRNETIAAFIAWLDARFG